MTDAQWHLVSYDVRDDKRRRKVHRHLAGWGDRVQYSVFRIHCTSRHLIRLRWELARHLDQADNLLIVPIPDSAARRIQTLHETTDWVDEQAAPWKILGHTRTV
jgi:CRISPR-associated protein Cas2